MEEIPLQEGFYCKIVITERTEPRQDCKYLHGYTPLSAGIHASTFLNTVTGLYTTDSVNVKDTLELKITRRWNLKLGAFNFYKTLDKKVTAMAAAKRNIHCNSG